MGRQNKKESVATLHRENILAAAEQLFLKKGVASTTIDDISKLSEYSRRTIYVYYESKEDILYHIILKGLVSLKDDLDEVFQQQKGFIKQYWPICKAMEKFQAGSPQSANSINQMKSGDVDFDSIPQVVLQIFEFGTKINQLLADYIEQGKEQGLVRSDVEPMKTVYIMWGSMTSLLSLVQNKGEFLEKEFSTTKDSFLEYGYRQIINSILEERI